MDPVLPQTPIGYSLPDRMAPRPTKKASASWRSRYVPYCTPKFRFYPDMVREASLRSFADGFALPRDRLCCISGTLSSPASCLLCSEVPVTRSQLLTLSTSSSNLVVSARLIGSFPQMLFVAGMVCSNEVFRVGEGGYILIDGTGKGLDILWLSMVESI